MLLVDLTAFWPAAAVPIGGATAADQSDAAGSAATATCAPETGHSTPVPGRYIKACDKDLVFDEQAQQRRRGWRPCRWLISSHAAATNPPSPRLQCPRLLQDSGELNESEPSGVHRGRTR
jgi:hypothetical protein